MSNKFVLSTKSSVVVWSKSILKIKSSLISSLLVIGASSSPSQAVLSPNKTLLDSTSVNNPSLFSFGKTG